jgi:hypothetical protein
MGDLLRILDAVESRVEVDNFPRAMFQASLAIAGQQADQLGRRAHEGELAEEGARVNSATQPNDQAAQEEGEGGDQVQREQRDADNQR